VIDEGYPPFYTSAPKLFSVTRWPPALLSDVAQGQAGDEHRELGPRPLHSLACRRV
jgi:hypothetical protein